MKLVFFGAGAFGTPTLARLCKNHEVLAVVTQPDRPAGRGRKLTPTPIGAWAIENLSNVPLIRTDNVNEPAVRDELRSFETDAWVVIAFGQKLGTDLLRDRPALNLHASLLPRWRGAAPINHAILAGDKETGNSVITLADRMDAGLVLATSKRPIDPSLTAGELHDLLSDDGPEPMLEALELLRANPDAGTPQDESLVTQAIKLSKADSWIDCSDTAEHCRQRVHGLTPWPGVSATLGSEKLKLKRVQAIAPSPEQDAEPGSVLDTALGLFSCKDMTALRLIEVQPEGKRAMSWDDYVRGRPVEEGARLKGDGPC